MKEYRPKLILTSLVALLPLFLGLLLWNQLPESIATHFGTDNQPDGWSSKPVTVFVIPMVLTALHLLCIGMTLHDPKKANISRKMLNILFWMIPLISCLTGVIFYANALGYALNPGRLVNLMLAVVFLLTGNYLSKTHQNYTVGIKLSWTLHSTENWNRTHRLGSKCFILGGLVFLVNVYFLSVYPLFIVSLACCFVPAIYSFVLYKKGI